VPPAPYNTAKPVAVVPVCISTGQSIIAAFLLGQNHDYNQPQETPPRSPPRIGIPGVGNPHNGQGFPKGGIRGLRKYSNQTPVNRQMFGLLSPLGHPPRFHVGPKTGLSGTFCGD